MWQTRCHADGRVTKAHCRVIEADQRVVATVATARHVRSGTARASLTRVVTPRAALRRAGRRVAGQGDAVHDAAVPGGIVDGVLLGAAIVPERERARAPAEAAGGIPTELIGGGGSREPGGLPPPPVPPA